MNQYQLKENKITNILEIISIIFFLIGVICLILIPLLHFVNKNINSDFGIIIFFFNLIFSSIFILISNFFSKEKKFTKVFINDIKKELKKATTIDEIKNIYKKLSSEAISETGIIRFSNPKEIKKLFEEIEYKLEILNNQKEKNYEKNN